MQEENFFEYHLYTLDRPTTIRENQTKQVSLLSAPQVPVTREYLLQGVDYYYRGQYASLGEKLKVGVFLDVITSYSIHYTKLYDVERPEYNHGFCCPGRLR